MKECVNCTEEMKPGLKPIKTKDDFEVCTNWCKDDWELDVLGD